MSAYLIHSKKWLLTIIVIATGILCTSYLSLTIKHQLRQESQAKLQAIAEQIQTRLHESIELAINDIRALEAFYRSSDLVTREEFTVYATTLFDNRHEYIQALSWVPIVKHDQRSDFVATMQKYHPDFRVIERNSQGEIITRTQSDYYYPVTYIEPIESNRKALGFDINSNLIRRVSLDFARDSGEITATAKIRLVQEVGDSFGFLMLLPVYSSNNASARKNALKGFISGVFRINNLIDSAQQLAIQENLLLTLTDHTSGKDDLLYGDTNTNADFSFSLNLPQRDWRLHLSMTDSLRERTESPLSAIWIMAGGVLLSVLLGICIYELIQSRISGRRIYRLNQQIQQDNIQLEATVTERTKDLFYKNQQLEEHVEELTSKRQKLVSMMEEAEAAKQFAEQQTRELERSNRDLRDFAYVASHDLKSPLRGIDQLASWVIEDLEMGKMAEIPENLTLMRQRVQRLEALLNDLLAYSRIGRDEEKISTADCAALVEELFILNASPSTFTLTIEDDLPVFSTAVAPFEQVLRNLLSNAVKHHDRDNGSIHVSCTEEEDFYTFAVSDDGIGIDAKQHENIFKMFKTLKPRDEIEGSGMGLSMIKKIVEYYGGKVYLESTIGQGTTFYFSWPKVLKNNTIA